MPNIFNETHDVVIVGGGPGGTACALTLLKHGIRPLIIEKETFPRYHIGESLTAEMGKRLREFGLESLMVDEHNFPVKRGVKVWGKGGHNDFYIPVQIADNHNQLHDSTTWQVRRADFDQILLEAAKERGAKHLQGRALKPIVKNRRVSGISVLLPDGRTKDIYSNMVVDASGQSTFMASKSNLTSETVRGKYDRQLAIFSQINGAKLGGDTSPGDTIIFYREKHHWSWFIPISDSIVSTGIVVPANFFRESKQTKEAFYQEHLFSLNPKLSERLENIEFVNGVHTASNYSYHVENFVGDGFLCIGDAHRFVDPIFSFGLHFAFHEGNFAAQAISDYFESGATDLSPLRAYQQKVSAGQDIIQDFIDCFWDFPAAFVIMAQFQFREQFIDLFSGRVYDNADDKVAVKTLREFLRKK